MTIHVLDTKTNFSTICIINQKTFQALHILDGRKYLILCVTGLHKVMA